MKVVIDENKLRLLLKARIEAYSLESMKRVAEANKDKQLDLHISKEEMQVIMDNIGKPPEEWPENYQSKIEKMLDASYEYVTKTDLAVMTLEEVAVFFTITPEDLKPLVVNIEELTKL